MRMFRIGLLTCAVLAIASASSVANAQVTEGAWRLYVDTSLFSYQRQQDDGDKDYESDRTIHSAMGGPGAASFAAGSGVGLGYVLSPNWIPQLYFGFQYLRLKQQYADTLRAFQLELRPLIELLPNRKWSVLPQLTVGCSLLYRDSFEGLDIDSDVIPAVPFTAVAVGPTLAVGMHAFVLPRATLDLSLLVRQLFFYAVGGDERFEKNTIRETAVVLQLGGSFWPESRKRAQ